MLSVLFTTDLTQVFLTDLLLSSPRLKFSEAQVEAILRWAKALKAEDVPTKYALDKSQRDLAKLIGNPTKKVTGRSGNIFYINDIAHALAKVSVCGSLTK